MKQNVQVVVLMQNTTYIQTVLVNYAVIGVLNVQIVIQVNVQHVVVGILHQAQGVLLAKSQNLEEQIVLLAIQLLAHNAVIQDLNLKAKPVCLMDATQENSSMVQNVRTAQQGIIAQEA